MGTARRLDSNQATNTVHRVGLQPPPPSGHTRLLQLHCVERLRVDEGVSLGVFSGQQLLKELIKSMF